MRGRPQRIHTHKPDTRHSDGHSPENTDGAGVASAEVTFGWRLGEQEGAGPGMPGDEAFD